MIKVQHYLFNAEKETNNQVLDVQINYLFQ